MTLIPNRQYALDVNIWRMKNKREFIHTLGVQYFCKGECRE